VGWNNNRSFLRKQAASGGEMSLELANFKMEELRGPLRASESASKDHDNRVSFQDANKRYNSSSSSS
jgi:hypothetical protein